MLPVILQVVGDVYHDVVAPVGFDGGPREHIIEDEHLTLDPVRRHRHIVHRQEVLHLVAPGGKSTSTVRPVSGVTS
jgi:hypothetical protein